MWSAEQHQWMARALQLAAHGAYTARPNPQVGCVLVRDGVVVGEGWHHHFGGPHAEVNALAVAGPEANGATAYVTLEPCSHTGKTPPCVDALIEAGVGRVVVAMEDPNPSVAGSGLERLQAAGIEVQTGLLEESAQRLNRGFIKRMLTGRPLVRCKLAMSLDGRTAMASGESQWITGPAARADVQKLRARHDAIITGSGTVLSDDPSLNVRPEQVANWPTTFEVTRLRQPLKVLLDRRGQVTGDSKLFATGEVLWVTSCSPLNLPDNATHLELPEAGLAAILDELGNRECNEVLIEAGHELAGAFLTAGLLDEIVIYMAPKLLGDNAKGLFHLPALETMADSTLLEVTDMRQVGADLRFTLRPQEH